jgi:histone H3/H4
MTSGELLDALNAKVHSMVVDACKRAQGNKRSTVRAHDL